MSKVETIGATQYLTFKLDDEIFAVDISKVREEFDFTTITKVPTTPAFMRGVDQPVKQRGANSGFQANSSMTETEKRVNTCITIVEVTVDNETTVLGALADSVQDVVFPLDELTLCR
jgi:purine-binding chemotaxis protein CheW